MTPDPRFLPGRKENNPRSGYDYLYSKHPQFLEIRKSDIKQRRFEEGIGQAIAALEQAIVDLRVAYTLSHGGWIDRQVTARSQVKASADPEQALHVALRGLPNDLPERALPPRAK